MSVADDVLAQLAERFGLDPTRIGRPAVFSRAIDEALRFGDASYVVGEVEAFGGLAGVREPWGVILRRLRNVSTLAAERERLADEADEAARWAQVDRAAKRGETLRALVDRGELFVDEGAGMLVREFPDGELRALAMAALEGTRP